MIRLLEDIGNMKEILRNIDNIDELAEMIRRSDGNQIIILKYYLGILFGPRIENINTLKDSIQQFIES